MTRNIMIVGNGEIEAGSAAIIDASDLVIRFNDCRSVGAGGQKTDIVAVCNTGRPARAMIEDGFWKANPAVIQAATIWCVRDPQKFAAMRVPLMKSHPELNDFCDDYTEGYRDFCAATAKAFHIVPASTHDRLVADLTGFGPETYVVPSSGLIAIAEFLAHHLRPDDQLLIAGFGHQGWQFHPFAAERRLVDRWAASGRLTRLVAPRLSHRRGG